MDMVSLLSKKERHLLWQDESGDDFVLLDFCEIYRKSEENIHLCFWNKPQADTVRKLIPNFDFESLDNRMYHFNTNKRNLAKILALNSRLKRLKKNSKRLKKLSEKLGHEILPYNPIIFKNEPGGEIPKQFQNLSKRREITIG